MFDIPIPSPSPSAGSFLAVAMGLVVLGAVALARHEARLAAIENELTARCSQKK